MPLFSGRCYSKVRLDGKTALITGCNTGIGKETVRDFYNRGARVIMACRSVDKAQAAADDIRNVSRDKSGTGQIEITQLDLSSLASVRKCAERLNKSERRIDLLVNNAGVMMCPETRTEDGYELQLATNHLGHFLFTLLLLPKIIAAAPSRIVTVSSLAHEGGTIEIDDLNFEKRKYSAIKAYQQSKLANVLFSKELARRLEANNINNVTTYSLHPGVITTELGRHLDATYFTGVRFLFGLLKWFIKTPELGAQTQINCAVSENLANESGYYYSDCVRKEPSKLAKDAELAKKLWDVSLKLVGLDHNYNPFKQ